MRAISFLLIITTAAASACNEFDFSYECQNRINNYNQNTINTMQYDSRTGTVIHGTLQGDKEYGYSGYGIDPNTGESVYMRIDRQGNLESF